MHTNITGERADPEEMATKVYESVNQGARMVILQDIVCSRRDPSGVAAMDRLQERLTYERFNPKKHEWVMFVWHGCSGWQHYHVYHTCSYRKSYCSCGIIRNQNIIPARRRVIQRAGTTQADFSRILKYHCSEGREIRHISIQGTVWKYDVESTDCTDGVRLPEGFLEACDLENTNIPGPDIPPSRNIGRFEKPDNSDTQDSTGRGEKKWVGVVSTYINNHVCVPIRNCLCLNEWRSMPCHLHINRQSFIITNMLEDIEFKYLSYTVRDFYDLYAKSDKLVYFKALNMEEYNRRYLSLRDSLISVFELLLFQFDYNIDAVQKFLELIYKMCDFRHLM